jgi:acyl-CoA thioester hydrolase
MKGFYFTASGKVPSQWIDKNGHMNIKYYIALFDQGCDVMLEKCGVARSSMADNGLTMVANRIFVAHKKELFEGEDWELMSGVVSLTPDFITLSHRLISGSSIRATCDIRGRFFNTKTRAATALDDKALERAREYIVPGLTDRFQEEP